MENTNKTQEKKELILAGVCPNNHNTEDRVCRGCYEDLLKQLNTLKNSNGKKKSQWQTW